MNGLHIFLGLGVVLLNGIGGAATLVRRGEDQEVPSLATWGHAALVIQLATGFFLFTATTEGPGIWHYLVPAVALAAILAARGMDGEHRLRAVGAATLGAALASVVVFATGLLDG